MLFVALSTGEAGEIGFSLNIGSASAADRRDPQTEARLAEWTSPMGRLLDDFRRQQSQVLHGGLPGSENLVGAAFRIKLQNGLSVELISASVDAGFDRASQAIISLPWPSRQSADPPPSLEEQLAVELGRRLTLRDGP